MINVENIRTDGWENALYGMRAPLQSWKRSDSTFDNNEIVIGDNDLQLMTRLIQAGTEHRKFLRFIHVSMVITAPSYWIAEQDTYKVATSRNSCSFMHTGIKNGFTINDFTVDENVKKLLSYEKQYDDIEYVYDTSEYKIYTCENGRKYKVYKNGKIVSCEFEVEDAYNGGRTKHFAEKELKPTLTNNGYFMVNLGGRNGTEKWMMHRLVLYVGNPVDNWYDLTVNHINGKKNQNNVENLEWCTREENISKAFADGLYDDSILYNGYCNWKSTRNVDIDTRIAIKYDYQHNNMNIQSLVEKYKLAKNVINNIVYAPNVKNNDLYLLAYYWEKMLSQLNTLRDIYLDTKDEQYFLAIRRLLPMGYKYTYVYDCSMETLLNMCMQRYNHRLPEWKEFISIVFKEVPYLEYFYTILQNNN